MDTITFIAILLLFIAGLYRANEINPQLTRAILKWCVAGLLMFAFCVFLVLLYFPHPVILAVLSLLCLGSAMWLLGGREWQ